MIRLETEHYGFYGIPLGWLDSFLTKEFIARNLEVPQDSILVPPFSLSRHVHVHHEQLIAVCSLIPRAVISPRQVSRALACAHHGLLVKCQVAMAWFCS